MKVKRLMFSVKKANIFSQKSKKKPLLNKKTRKYFCNCLEIPTFASLFTGTYINPYIKIPQK